MKRRRPASRANCLLLRPPLTWSRWVRPASRARGIASEMCAACGVGVAVGPCCEEECTVECGREQSVGESGVCLCDVRSAAGGGDAPAGP